jgi:hypothetical protein
MMATGWTRRLSVPPRKSLVPHRRLDSVARRAPVEPTTLA